jgi:hypothetical protein
MQHPPASFYVTAAEAIPEGAGRTQTLRQLVQVLKYDSDGGASFATLAALLRFLAAVATYADTNLMTTSNLGVVFAPNLLRPEGRYSAVIFTASYAHATSLRSRASLTQTHILRPLIATSII